MKGGGDVFITSITPIQHIRPLNRTLSSMIKLAGSIRGAAAIMCIAGTFIAIARKYT